MKSKAGFLPWAQLSKLVFYLCHLFFFSEGQSLPAGWLFFFLNFCGGMEILLNPRNLT